jgi:hypothetical protein
MFEHRHEGLPLLHEALRGVISQLSKVAQSLSLIGGVERTAPGQPRQQALNGPGFARFSSSGRSWCKGRHERPAHSGPAPEDPAGMRHAVPCTFFSWRSISWTWLMEMS